MNKEELINALYQLEIDGEIVCNEQIECVAQKIIELIKSSHPTETPKVGKHEQAKEVNCLTCIYLKPPTNPCDSCDNNHSSHQFTG